MKLTTIKAFVALIFLFIIASCSKDEVDPVVNPVNEALAKQIAQIADFKLILPQGNQIVANGKDTLNYDILFLDEAGNVINDKLPKVVDIIGIVDVNGEKMYLSSAIKSSKVGNYNITITVGKITKSYPIIATTADKKVIEIPIIFNFVSTDYSDKVVDLTFTNLVNTYKRNGVDNVIFKLAELDNDGKPLTRRGVKFWNFEGTATDLMDYKKMYGNKYAFDVYLIVNKKIEGASAYANQDHIVIDNDYFNLPGKLDINVYGWGVIEHEMGHVFGLKHVYRDDNICQVQEGVNDIQAISSNGAPFDVKSNSFTTICGGKQKAGNVMGNAGLANITYFTPDQVNVAKKNIVELKF